MITAHEIFVKAEKQYKKYLSSVVSGENLFPIVIPCDKKPGKDLQEYFEEITDIKSLSKEVKSFGYSITWVQITKKSIGRQDIPEKIYFDNEIDFVKFLKKEKEVAEFRNNVLYILHDFPILREWIINHPLKIVENSSNLSGLLKVLSYFKANPKPDLYIRELPINLHTKFIERNESVLKELLDIIIPDYVNKEESMFEKRYTLKYDEPSIRIRTLDSDLSLKYFSGIDDVSVPESCIKNFDFDVKNVFVVENKINFLTFPNISDSIVVWGHGYGVSSIKNLSFIKNVKLYYWGDLDAQGFEILSQFRSYFRQTKSFLMDKETFYKYFENEEGKQSKVSVELNLTDEEYILYEIIKKNNWRLEQEKIPQSYLIDTLNNMGFNLIIDNN